MSVNYIALRFSFDGFVRFVTNREIKRKKKKKQGREGKLTTYDGGKKNGIFRHGLFEQRGLLTRLTRRVNARISQLCVLLRYIKREHERGGETRSETRATTRVPL